MPRTLRISEDDARALVTNPDKSPMAYAQAFGRLQAALARLDRVPKPQKRRPKLDALARGTLVLERLHRADRKAQKTARRQDIRTAVFLRAGGICEGPGALWFGVGTEQRCQNQPTDLSHLFGRGRGRLPESERTCAAWCRLCHNAFGASRPSAAMWWGFIAWWLMGNRFDHEAAEARKRQVFVETRANLPAAPRVR